MDSETALYLYLHGLEPDTSKEVRLRQPTSLVDAIQQATIVHSILHPNGPPSAPAPTKPAQPTLPPTEPMDLDHIRTLLASFSALNNIAAASTTIANFRRPNSRLPKLDKAEKERCIREGRCFRCRNKGHIAEKCTGPTAMYNIETSNDSGNE